QQGDLLHIAFDSGLSRSVENAFAAAEELKEEFPERKIYVVDSTCGCVGYGLFVDTLADMRDSLNTVDELYEWAMENRKNVHHYFFSTTLKYFRKSGRISTPSALIGELLKICPLMRVNNEGKIVAYSKAICIGKAINKTMQEVKQRIYGGGDYGDRIWIAHSNCADNAESMKNALRESFPYADIKLWDIGPVIGSHCGPGTVSLYFWGNER
ncbi:MAG: DegV family protein, partial [Roseburia sp.]|nr:DegV family protein [Roseburia sp.]